MITTMPTCYGVSIRGEGNTVDNGDFVVIIFKLITFQYFFWIKALLRISNVKTRPQISHFNLIPFDNPSPIPYDFGTY